MVLKVTMAEAMKIIRNYMELRDEVEIQIEGVAVVPVVGNPGESKSDYTEDFNNMRMLERWSHANKIPRIKNVRESTCMSLFDAKRFVDQLDVEGVTVENAVRILKSLDCSQIAVNLFFKNLHKAIEQSRPIRN